LKKNGYSTYQDELNNNSIRFVTAWNTTENDIKKLVSTISNK
jgi:threonine aldolase